MDEYHDFPRYYNMSKLAYEVESLRSRKIRVIAGKGQWDFATPGEMYPATQEEVVEKVIQEATQELDSQDHLTIFINDHGLAPRHRGDPLSSRIVLYWSWFLPNFPTVSHRRLMDLLLRYVPQSVYVRLIGAHCFAGGLHSIAFQLNQVCSAASTDFKSESSSSNEIDSYAKGFWEEVRMPKVFFREDGKVNLYQSHFSGFMADSENEGRNEISSMAYVDFILREGAYADFPLFPTLYDEFLGPSGEFDFNSDHLDEVKRKFNSVFQALTTMDENEPVFVYTPQFKKVRQYLLLDGLKNKDVYFFIFKWKENEISHLKSAWDSLNPIEKIFERSEYGKKLERIRSRAKKELSHFIAHYKTALNLVKVNRFLKQARSDEKIKFLKLVQCEWNPL